jgi:hypothetical protein
MAVLDENHSENKTETFASAACAPQSEADLEIERQCYDVRHIMRLRDEGKPYKTHLDDRRLLKSSSGEWSMASTLMRRYLGEMKRDVERELERRLSTMPFDQALNNKKMFWWWGIGGQGLLQFVYDWYAQVHSFNDKSEPFIAPASWLLKWRPPVPFDFGKSPLSTLRYKLIEHLVEGKDWPPVAAASNLPDQKRAA